MQEKSRTVSQHWKNNLLNGADVRYIAPSQPETNAREFSFQNGLQAAMEEFCPKREIKCETTTTGEYLFFSFLLQGSVVGTCDGLFRNRTVSSGFGGCWYTPDRHGTTQSPAGKPLHRMVIGLDREFIDNRLGGTENPGFPRSLIAALEQREKGCYHRPFPITPWMQSLIHQLLHNPYQGLLGKLYAEGLTLKIIVQIMDAMGDEDQKEVDVRLSSRDVELVHQAGEILVQSMEDPPSVISLAKAVGLNETKLKKGFRVLFGSTVFGYLRKQRMMHARDLLSGGDVTVCQAASAVGYVNASHFSKSFMNAFGVLPGSYLCEARDRATVAQKNLS